MDEIVQSVTKIVENHLKGENVTPDSLLVDLNADSLDMVEIFMDIEEAHGVEIPDNAIDMKVATPRTLAQYIKEKHDADSS